MNVCDYVNEISKNISEFGGDKSDVFNSSVSNAIVTCFNIMSTYASYQHIKTIPVPFAVIGKNNDCTKCLENNCDFASIKFSSNLNLDIVVLNKIIFDLGLSDYVNVEPFSSSINLEIYVPVLVNRIK